MARIWALLFVFALLGLGGCADDANRTEGNGPEGDDSVDSVAVASSGGSDTFGLVQMGHTAHDFAEDARAWDGTSEEGRYAYVSAPCDAEAPVNNNASNLPTLNSRLPRPTSPASARMHPLEFEVDRSGEGAGKLKGRMSLTVCQPEPEPSPDGEPTGGDSRLDVEKDRIVFEWTATYQRASEEETVFDGRFEIQEGTGRYQGISGSGSLHGYFMCSYVPEDCAEAGARTDVMLLMIGTYDHPDL